MGVSREASPKTRRQYPGCQKKTYLCKSDELSYKFSGDKHTDLFLRRLKCRANYFTSGFRLEAPNQWPGLEGGAHREVVEVPLVFLQGLPAGACGEGARGKRV